MEDAQRAELRDGLWGGQKTAVSSDGAFGCGPCSPPSSGCSSDFCWAKLNYLLKATFGPMETL